MKHHCSEVSDVSNNKDESARRGMGSVVSYFVYCIVGMTVFLCLSFLFSLLIAGGKIPENAAGALSCASVVVGVGISSAFSVRRFGRGLFSALLQGLLSFAVIYLIGALLFSRFVPETISPSVLLSCLGGSVIGAVFSAFGKQKKRRKKRS